MGAAPVVANLAGALITRRGAVVAPTAPRPMPGPRAEQNATFPQAGDFTIVRLLLREGRVANEIDVLTRFMTEHYPGVKAYLEWFRAEHPEQWSRPDQRVWRQVDKTVPRALVWEWMAFKAELSRQTFLDPKQREIDLETVRQKARAELAAKTHEEISRYLCETALQWPAAFLPGSRPPFNQAELAELREHVRELKKQHPEIEAIDDPEAQKTAIAASMPDRLLRAAAAQEIADVWHAIFGGPKRLDG